jgi:protein-arginine kinase activator protein McsA
MELVVEENYLDLTIDEVYDVISHVNVWPASFDIDKKIKLMTRMINYFVEKEEYEKCAFLQEYINGLENNKQTDRHGRIEPN